MEDNRIHKINLLMQQGKYKEAERLLKDLLSADAGDINLLYLLAEAYLQQDNISMADSVIDNAIGLSPDSAHLYYLKARAAMLKDDFKGAEKLVDQCISLDPSDADYYALSANIKLTRKDYQGALAQADQALSLEPENILALNTRSSALIKLDRESESYATIEGALREDPTNAYTHANYGWALLEKGEHKKALEHFRESLKNDPQMEYAHTGMMEAMKAANPMYRLFLKYSFWIGNLTARNQWIVILGFYFGVKGLRTLAMHKDALRPYLLPLVVLLSLIAFSTWVITPISDLFLRFSKYGQFLLSKKKKMSSNFVAGSFILFLTAVILFLIIGDEMLLSVAMFGFLMMVPYSSMFAPSKFNLLLWYSAAMTLAGFLAIGASFYTGDLFNTFSVIFVIGFIAFQWLANFVVIKSGNY